MNSSRAAAWYGSAGLWPQTGPGHAGSPGLRATTCTCNCGTRLPSAPTLILAALVKCLSTAAARARSSTSVATDGFGQIEQLHGVFPPRHQDQPAIAGVVHQQHARQRPIRDKSSIGFQAADEAEKPVMTRRTGVDRRATSSGASPPRSTAPCFRPRPARTGCRCGTGRSQPSTLRAQCGPGSASVRRTGPHARPTLDNLPCGQPRHQRDCAASTASPRRCLSRACRSRPPARPWRRSGAGPGEERDRCHCPIRSRPEAARRSAGAMAIIWPFTGFTGGSTSGGQSLELP